MRSLLKSFLGSRIGADIKADMAKELMGNIVDSRPLEAKADALVAEIMALCGTEVSDSVGAAVERVFNAIISLFMLPFHTLTRWNPDPPVTLDPVDEAADLARGAVDAEDNDGKDADLPLDFDIGPSAKLIEAIESGKHFDLQYGRTGGAAPESPLANTAAANPLQCPYCDHEPFSRPQDLSNHIRMKHAEKWGGK
jgi:hypothetical protein